MYKLICQKPAHICPNGFGEHFFSNVYSKDCSSKFRSNTVLCLLRNLLEQSLLGMYNFVSIPNPKISYKPFWIEVMLLIPYLNFATLDYGLVELVSSIVSLSSFTESDKTKPLWSTLIEYDFHIQ